MAAKSRSTGSARGKPTDLTRKQDSLHKIEPARDEARHPLKSGRNMGGRGLMGERQRPTTRNKSRFNSKVK
jgi:hypothetical protein